MTLVSSATVEFLDMFRVPYAVEGDHAESGAGRIESTRGAELVWLAPDAGAGTRHWYRIGDLRAYGALASKVEVQRALERSPRDWRTAEPVIGTDGATAAHVWRANDGSALLPFDPDALVRAFLREEYLDAGRATSIARTLYYRVRPLLPRRLQLAARRRFARIQDRQQFPSWPTETALDALFRYLLLLVERVHGSPLAWIAPWPQPYEWAVVLTHDVERSVGYRYLPEVASVERALGVRSAWYLVPERDYVVDEDLVRALREDGFEVGVHGLRHDGNDLSPGTFEQRLPDMRRFAERWGAVGFRAPATQRDWARIARLGFDYDSSYSDVARYEPQSGGSCSWLPFFVADVVELPITLPMDHTLFELLGHRDVRTWFQKAEFLRSRGGMALLLTHPDYLLDPFRLGEYRRFVARVADDDTAWLALPRDVARWWRDRASSSLELQGAVWRVVGPAAPSARVVLGASAF